jgi:hypothetical protein
MCSVVLAPEPYTCHPFIYQTGVLSGAYVRFMVDPAGKSVIIKPAPSTPKPSQNAGTCWFKQFELYRPSSLSLNDDDPRPHPLAADKLTDLQFDDVTTAQLAVDGEVKHGAVAYTPLSIEPETDGPNLLRFESTLGAELPSCVPWTAVLEGWVVL